MPGLHGFNKFEGKPSSSAGQIEGQEEGDVAARFKEADVIQALVHHAPGASGYIEPHACLISVAADNKTTIWSSSQGQFMVRAIVAHLAGIPRATSALSPPKSAAVLAARPSSVSSRWRRCCRKIRPPDQNGDDPRGGDACHRPDIGLEEHGKDRSEKGWYHRRRAGTFYLRAGRAAGLADPQRGRLRLFAYRTYCRSALTCCPTAPGSQPIARRARRSAPMQSSACSTRALAEALKMDPLELRLKNAAKLSTKACAGPVFDPHCRLYRDAGGH